MTYSKEETNDERFDEQFLQSLFRGILIAEDFFAIHQI
jgi:hypothetical protein